MIGTTKNYHCVVDYDRTTFPDFGLRSKTKLKIVEYLPDRVDLDSFKRSPCVEYQKVLVCSCRSCCDPSWCCCFGWIALVVAARAST